MCEQKAEAEVYARKRKFEELMSRILRLEEDLMNGMQGKLKVRNFRVKMLIQQTLRCKTCKI